MPQARSKPKDKRAGKETAKGTLKPSGHATTGTGTMASGYNPLLGAFQTFEAAPGPSQSTLRVNSRFQNIDETDDHSNPSGPGIEYDSVSNNGSWSGESEDLKERASNPPRRHESIPGADNDRREKIRQKNEKKHQRQKEKRAQELHERCSGYLMSWKLEALTRQLVSMGFSQERAMMALILNDGRVEESVAWLFECGEEDQKTQHNLDAHGNLKIDISEEIARIRELEMRYQASIQEVERAVVSCEGDLEKAEETLKAQKERPATPSKPEETVYPITLAGAKVPISSNQNSMAIQSKSTSSYAMNQQTDDKDFNYTKIPPRVGSSIDPGARSVQMLKKIPPQLDWAKQQQTAVSAERIWSSSASNPSASFSLPSPMQGLSTLPMSDLLYAPVDNGLKNLQLGSVKDQVMIERRQQYPIGRQNSSSTLSSSPPIAALGRYANSVETLDPCSPVPTVTGSRSLVHSDVNSIPLGNQLPYQYQTAVDNQHHYLSQQQLVSSSSSTWDSLGTSQANRGRSKGTDSPLRTATASLGLFSGLGTSRFPSPNWSADGGSYDYTNIDWSLDRGTSSGVSMLRSGTSHLMQDNPRWHDSSGYSAGGNSVRIPIRLTGSNGSIPGLYDRVDSKDPSAGTSRDWTSPFEENDLFSVPRQFVSFPSFQDEGTTGMNFDLNKH